MDPNAAALLQRLSGIFSPNTDVCSESLCPGSTFSAISAAFASQGYWAQADMLYLINETNFQSLAILIYVVAVSFGIMGMAMGNPPKQYTWYFLGPALFQFLVGTTYDATGTRWVVGGNEDQKEVWRLVEPGLANMAIVKRMGNVQLRNDGPPTCSGGGGLLGSLGGGASSSRFLVGNLGGSYNGTPCTVKVSYVFSQIDWLVSGVVQTMVKWLGGFAQLRPGTGAANSNLPSALPTGGSNNIFRVDRWYMMSNLKWEILESITNSKLHNPDIRDAFVQFLSNECGDALKGEMDPEKFISVAKGGGSGADGSVMKGAASDFTQSHGAGMLSDTRATTIMQTVGNRASVPAPLSLMRLASSTTASTSANHSVKDFILDLQSGNSPSTDLYADIDKILTGNVWNLPLVSCSSYFTLVINLFRWEAAHLYFNTFANSADLPPGITPSQAVYNLLYGWPNTSKNLSTGGPTTSEEQNRHRYLYNLLLTYLIRNEMIIAPKPFIPQVSTARQEMLDTETSQRTTGQKAKFGEVYVWAKMMPYFQGILLYLLALAFPFCCMFVVIPGWHKIMFTWMNFWIWAKLWDVGFAVVTNLERSIWAYVANPNTDSASMLNARIADMNNIGTGGTQTIETMFSPGNLDPSGVLSLLDPGQALRVFDRALAIGFGAQFDLANANYIYLMSALYFAVPAVMGQVVLGAKAGAAGMLTSPLQSMAGEVGKSAVSSWQQTMSQNAQGNMDVAKKAMWAKGMRAKDGEGNQLAAEMIASQNAQSRFDLLAAGKNARSSSLGNRLSTIEASQSILQASAALASTQRKWELSGARFNYEAVSAPLQSLGKGMQGALKINANKQSSPISSQPPLTADPPMSPSSGTPEGFPSGAGGAGNVGFRTYMNKGLQHGLNILDAGNDAVYKQIALGTQRSEQMAGVIDASSRFESTLTTSGEKMRTVAEQSQLSKGAFEDQNTGKSIGAFSQRYSAAGKDLVGRNNYYQARDNSLAGMQGGMSLAAMGVNVSPGQLPGESPESSGFIGEFSLKSNGTLFDSAYEGSHYFDPSSSTKSNYRADTAVSGAFLENDMKDQVEARKEGTISDRLGIAGSNSFHGIDRIHNIDDGWKWMQQLEAYQGGNSDFMGNSATGGAWFVNNSASFGMYNSALDGSQYKLDPNVANGVQSANANPNTIFNPRGAHVIDDKSGIAKPSGWIVPINTPGTNTPSLKPVSKNNSKP